MTDSVTDWEALEQRVEDNIPRDLWNRIKDRETFHNVLAHTFSQEFNLKPMSVTLSVHQDGRKI
jgi:hypothetical protein